jgi:Domain of unknown function (DUF5615)
MHAPVVAATLRDRGYDVTAVADDPDLRAMTDEELFGYAAAQGRRIVTENIKDFRRLLLRAGESGRATAGLLFTSSRTFPRTRRNPGPLIDALDAWLAVPDAANRPTEDWLGLR